MPVGRKESFSIQLLQLSDAALVWLSFWLADLARTPVREFIGKGSTDAAGIEQMTWVLFLAVPFTPLVLGFFRFYDRVRNKSTVRALSQLFRGAVVMALALGVFALFLKPLEAERFEASRLVLGLGGTFTFLFLFTRDRLFSHYLRNRRIRSDFKERVVVAGSVREIEGFLDETDPEVLENLQVVAQFDLEVEPVGRLYELLKAESVARVIFVAGDAGFAKVAECVEACELQGVEAWIAASFMSTQVARPTFDLMGDKPMLVLRSTPELSWELAMKAVFDYVLGAFILIVTLPLWVFAWVGIKLTSPGAPAMFSQKRAGRYGQPFHMWKFRTMVPNAEALLEKVREEHGNQMDGPVFKLDNDPRVFGFGALLRKLSIDELPQLINVIRGEMSLVGPRPLPLYEVEAFKKSSHRRRLSVKPGITCEWQAGGRNQITSFEQWVEMDLRYIDNWSFWLDLKILFKTVPAVIFGWGAR